MIRALSAAIAILAAAPAAAQPAGTLLAREPIANAPAGMRAWRIRYLTTDDRGRPAEATGIVAAPAGPAGTPRRVIAWAHGTWGTARKCAPSQSADFFTTTAALGAIREGYVVVAPDYPGLGTPSPHPYLIGPATARSVLAAVQAARRMPLVNAGPGFAVWGESQGGHAALWAGQLARTEARDLRLVGVAAGAPPTDLAANFREAGDPNARAFLTALTAESWSRYHGLPLTVGARRSPAIMRRLAANCLQVGKPPRFGAILGIAALRQDLRNTDFPALQPWAPIVARNSVAARMPVPVLIAQAQSDPLVAPRVTRDYARRLCATGTAVRWLDLPGKDHINTARDSATQTIRWITARFDGKNPRSDCRSL